LDIFLSFKMAMFRILGTPESKGQWIQNHLFNLFNLIYKLDTIMPTTFLISMLQECFLTLIMLDRNNLCPFMNKSFFLHYLNDTCY